MKKYIKILSALALAVLAANACQKLDADLEPEQPQKGFQLQGRQLTLRASWSEDSSTKTVVSGTSVLWTAEEKLNLFYGAAYSGLFTSTNTETVAVAEFTGSLSAIEGAVPQVTDSYWAVYPYDASNTCDGESVTLSVPSYQVASEGTFANNLFPAVGKSSNLEMSFHNVCGGVRFSVSAEGIRVLTFKGRGGESLAGWVKVALDNDGLPVIQNVLAGEAEVSVVAPDGGNFEPGKQYFAVLIPQALDNGLEITFRKSAQWATYKMEQGVTVRRSRFGILDGKDAGLTYENAPVDRLAFVDPNFAEYVFTNFDADNDGVLSQEEQNAVTSISVSTQEITAVDNLYLFPNLETLSCAGSVTNNQIMGKLTALDISQNPKLTFVNCFANQISSLDVSANRQLIRLNCGYNQLTALDVRQNPVLNQLRCDGNQLTVLDLRQNPELSRVDCYSNQLTSLDVTNNPKLACLYCNNNKIASLNLTQCPELVQLNGQNNRLTALDLSGNAKLQSASLYYNGIESLDVTKNTALQELYVYGNPLGSLDVTKNLALVQLDVEDTGLSTLDLSFNQELTYLYCSANYFTELDVSNNLKLTFLYALRNESLATLYMQEGQSIDRFFKPDYTEIVYVKNIYPDAFADANFRAFVFSNFDTNGNGILSQGERLTVTEMSLTCDNISSLAGLDSFPNLSSLYCVGSNPGSGQLTAVDLSGNPALSMLWLTNNQLAGLDLSQNKDLIYLYVGDNKLTGLDLSKNPGLRSLDCTGNLLTEMDMSQNLQLKNLLCDGNPELTAVWVARGHVFDSIDRPDLIREKEASGDGGKGEGYGHGGNGKWD